MWKNVEVSFKSNILLIFENRVLNRNGYSKQKCPNIQVSRIEQIYVKHFFCI